MSQARQAAAEALARAIVGSWSTWRGEPCDPPRIEISEDWASKIAEACVGQALVEFLRCDDHDPADIRRFREIVETWDKR